MRYVRAAALTIAAIATTAPASAGETIRVETRPFYGAVITREAGVRVYRPLPPTSKMIINPGGKTPLNINIEDRDDPPYYPYGPYGMPYGARGDDDAYGYLAQYYMLGYLRHGHRHHGHGHQGYGHPGHRPVAFGHRGHHGYKAPTGSYGHVIKVAPGKH